MVCEKCGGVRTPDALANPSVDSGGECACTGDEDGLTLLLRLLTLLSNCGLSAGAPTVLKSGVRK